MPCSCALRPASSAATWAAYGVDLREPLKPLVPDDDQAMVLPCASVIVIIVLLNEALTCATPDVMFFFSRLRTLARPAGAVVSLAIRRFSRGRAATRHSKCVVSGMGACLAAAPEMIAIRPSSCRRSAWPDPCGCGRWCACAGRERADPCGGADRGSSRGPSGA